MHSTSRSLPVVFSVLFITSATTAAISSNSASPEKRTTITTTNTTTARNRTTSKAVEENGISDEVRNLVFPSDLGIGQLTLFPLSHGAGRMPRERQTTVGVAKGKMAVTVPSDKGLMLEIGRRVFDKPTLLNEVSTVGIDCIKSAFWSMEEGPEDGAKCDRILKYIPRFKDLRFIELDRSDTSDLGVSNLKGMKKLEVITLFMTPVTGTCFKDFRTLPALNRIDADICPIKEENLAYLSFVPRLKSVTFVKSHISTTGVKLLAKCHSIESLNLRSNPKIDDNCIPALLTLKHLHRLDLWETPVTTEGILRLKVLPITTLGLPQSRYSERNLALLKAAFPNARLIVSDHRKLNKDDKKLFAPTSDR